jgi:hypothetical protein
VRGEFAGAVLEVKGRASAALPEFEAERALAEMVAPNGTAEVVTTATVGLG